MDDPDEKERGAGRVLLCYTGVLLGVGSVCACPFFYDGVKDVSTKKGDILNKQNIALKVLEAASGFEPLNHGFADQCLSRLATPPIDA